MAGSPSGFRANLSQILEVVPPARKRTMTLLALLTAAGAFCEVVAIGSVVPFLALLSYSSGASQFAWIGAAFEAVGARSRDEQLVAATAALCLAALAAAIFRILLARKTQDFAFSIGHEISVEAQRRMLVQPYSWHLSHNSSEQLAAISKVEIVAAAVLLPLMQSLAAALLILVLLIALLQIAPGTTVIAGVALAAAYYALGLHARHRLTSNSLRLRAALEQRIRILQEGLGGIRDVILDGSHEKVLGRFRGVDFDLARARANTGFVSILPRYLIEPVAIAIIAGLALYMAQRPGGLVTALPVLGALALAAQRLLPLVQQLYNGWSNIAANRSLLDDVVQQLKLTIPARPPDGPKLPFEKRVEFRNVSFTYESSSEHSVEGLSFTLPRGSRLGLIGPTGSGKSTTADLMMGLLEPSDGIIHIDGVPLNDGNRQAWRGNIAHVPQILFLADASIAQNIAMTDDYDEDRVREAAGLAQLHDFVTGLPEGYGTTVGERGVRISGGQRQRLALARAIYKDAALLVLDEATSALDDDTEAAVATALDALQSQGKTIVIIAHRSSLVETCNGLVRLREGRIVECSGVAAT